MRQVLLAGPLLEATLNTSAVSRVPRPSPNAVVEVDRDDFVLALQRYESLRQSCFGKREPAARVQDLRYVDCTLCKRLTCAYECSWSCALDACSHTPGHHYPGNIVVAVEKSILRKLNVSLGVCRARRTCCEAHAGTVRVRDVVKRVWLSRLVQS